MSVWSRRDILELEALGALDFSCPGLVFRDPLLGQGTGGTARTIRSCIIVFYYGGPSHLDTFDMKPDAPSEVRGEFESIPTSVPGLRISDALTAHGEGHAQGPAHPEHTPWSPVTHRGKRQHAHGTRPPHRRPSQRTRDSAGFSELWCDPEFPVAQEASSGGAVDEIFA